MIKSIMLRGICLDVIWEPCASGGRDDSRVTGLQVPCFNLALQEFLGRPILGTLQRSLYLVNNPESQ